MWIAAIDPQLAPTIGAIAVLAGALGLAERHRRKNVSRKTNGNGREVDRQAAETLLTQWKAVLEAMRTRAEFAEGSLRRCEAGRDQLEEKVRVLEWEKARLDWLDTQRSRKRTPRAE